MIGLSYLGHYAGTRYLATRDQEAAGLGTIEGASFALFGLLVALTFSGAVERFKERRHLILQEAQAIGTVYSRFDLLPEPVRKDLQSRTRAYLRARLEAYDRLESLERFEADMYKAEESAMEIWRISAETCRKPEFYILAEQILPPINLMLDMATARTVAVRIHPPAIIYWFLVGLALFSAFLAGFAMARTKKISLVHVAGFALITVATLLVTLDIEHPRLGFIRIDAADRVLYHTLDTMR